MPRLSLPIDSHLPEILAQLECSSNLILKSSPGSGKTTRVPPALLEAPWLGQKREILVLVPRRLAAKMAAYRVAEERGEGVGQTVGYQFRFERVMGARTRLKFLTEGTLLHLLMADPELAGVGAVVLDEFHERHLHSDVALAFLRRLQNAARPDLRLLVMSATLETESLSRYLGNCPVISFASPPFPLSVEYLTFPKEKRLEQQVREGLNRAWESKPEGDILVFLPGMADILRVQDELRHRWPGDALILPLHGESPREIQERVFKPAAKRKIILSTNVAESSLTLPGVRVVIDSGLHRQANFSWWSGIPSLKTRPISQASAIQRAGRAARTAEGCAFRLFSEGDFEARPSQEVPEIRRSDLSQILLELKALGAGDLASFPWFEAPEPSSVEASLELLFLLGALEEKFPRANLTDMGRRMAQLAVHPRLSRILLEAERRKVLEPTSTLVAALSEGETEALDLMELMHRSPSERVRLAKRQYLKNFRTASESLSGAQAEDPIAFSLLTGFPDRVAKRRRAGSAAAKEIDLVFSFGGSGSVGDPGSLREEDLFIVLDVEERQAHWQRKAQVHVHTLCPIREDWLLDLQPSLLQEETSLQWEEPPGRVVESSRWLYDQLVLSESLKPARPSKAAHLIFLKEALGLDPESLEPARWGTREVFTAMKPGESRDSLAEFFLRLFLLDKYQGAARPEQKVNLREVFMKILEPCLSRKDFNELRCEEAAWALVPSEIMQALERDLPSSLTLASGRKVAIHYDWDKEPWIESRLQDFFGMKQIPPLMGGRLAVTIHFLAPNYRAVQVTQDLPGFWKNTYPELRPQLSRRYPKHAWPENPADPAALKALLARRKPR